MPNATAYLAYAQRIAAIASSLSTASAKVSAAWRPGIITGGTLSTVVAHGVEDSVGWLSGSVDELRSLVDECRRRAAVCEAYGNSMRAYRSNMANYQAALAAHQRMQMAAISAPKDHPITVGPFTMSPPQAPPRPASWCDE